MKEPIPPLLAQLGMTNAKWEEMGQATDELLDSIPPPELFKTDPFWPYVVLLRHLPEEGSVEIYRHNPGLDVRELGSLIASLAEAADGNWDAAAKALEAADWDLRRAIDTLNQPLNRAVDTFLDRMTECDRAALLKHYEDAPEKIGPWVMELAAAADSDVEVMLGAALMTGWDLQRAVRRLADHSQTYGRLRRRKKKWLRAWRAARRLGIRRPWWMPRWLVDFLLDLRQEVDKKKRAA